MAGQPHATIQALQALHTHLYPGARLRREDTGTPPRAGDALLIVFSDLARSSGRLLALDDQGGWLIETAPYATARGTAITAKRWRLQPLPDDSGLYRVRKT